MTVKVLTKKSIGVHDVYDIHNFEPGLQDGNFAINDKIVHNSILANGVRNFDDLMLLSAMGHPGPMNCCWSYSNIDTDNGSTKLSQLDNTKHRIKCKDNDGNIISTNKYKVVKSGVKKLLKITLEDGRIINISPDHVVYTKDGPKQARDLSPGQDYAVCDESHIGSSQQI